MPRERTLAPPALFSTFGAAPVSDALSESVLTGAEPVPFAEAAAGFGADAAGGCEEGMASPRLAIMGVGCWFCCRW